MKTPFREWSHELITTSSLYAIGGFISIYFGLYVLAALQFITCKLKLPLSL